jgi:hypothetical protein
MPPRAGSLPRDQISLITLGGGRPRREGGRRRRRQGRLGRRWQLARHEEHDAIPLEYLLYPMGACWSGARAAAGVRGVG